MVRFGYLSSLMAAFIVVNSPTSAAEHVDWQALAAKFPAVSLDPVFHAYQKATCQFFGFSFDDNEDELRKMREVGARFVISNGWWLPVQDESAPNGLGHRIIDRCQGVPLSQEFVADFPFTAAAVCCPTYNQRGSGLTLSLYTAGNRAKPVARERFEDVADNSWLVLEFPTQEPGTYIIEADDPKGEIGIWAVPAKPGVRKALIGPADAEKADDCRSSSMRCKPDLVFALKLRRRGEDMLTDVIPDSHSHIPVKLARPIWDSLRDLGIAAAVSVGDQNNGFFPYYPDWFYSKYPDFTMLDQNGEAFVATMFDKPAGWPPIDHPEQMEGCRAFTTDFCALHRDEQAIALWILGGEALYPTYCFPSRFSDYSRPAIVHFQEWLKERYGTISELNRAWKRNYARFQDVQPPKQMALDIPWRDWTDFRYRAMAERFAWLYQSVLAGDQSRLAISCNHGDIYQGRAAQFMGAMPEFYAAVSDGFETGQIVLGADPDFFNMLYAESLSSLGEPIAPARLAYKFPNPRARGGGTSYTPEALRRYAYETLGSGAWLLGLIQWRGSLPDGEWGMKGTPAIDEAKKVFRELESLSPTLEHMYALRPKVGVYLSRYTWSLLGFDTLWKVLHVGLIERQIPKAYLYDSSDFSAYPVIISPNNDILSTEARAKLKDYVEHGGKLIVIGRFGSLDEDLSQTKPPFSRGGARRWQALPGSLAKHLGRGQVVFLDGIGTGKDMVDMVVAALRAMDIRPPAIIRAKGTAARKMERLLNDRAWDTPLDLKGKGWVGQTFRSPVGRLAWISFSTPTYRKEVKDLVLRVRIRRKGPGGEILGERAIPASELTDNSQHKIPITAAVKPGEKLLLEILEPPELAEQNLGIWTTSEDSYPDGELIIGGKPAKGDMSLWICAQETVPATRMAEAFTLTDGLNFLQVLINLSDRPLELTASIDPEILPEPIENYAAQPAVPLPAGSKWRREGNANSCELTLAPHGTAVIAWMRRTSRAEAAKALAVARERAKALGESQTSYSRSYLSAARRAMARADYPKAYALSARAAAAPGIALRYVGRDNVSSGGEGKVDGCSGFRMVVEVMDPGRNVRDAFLTAQMKPGFDAAARLRNFGGGKFEILFEECGSDACSANGGRNIRRGKYGPPRVYDYPRRTYDALRPPFAVYLTARHRGGIAAERIVISAVQNGQVKYHVGSSDDEAKAKGREDQRGGAKTMKKTNEIHIRDPFILPVPEEGKYYMYGTTDIGPGRHTKKFDTYISCDLENWEGPIPIFDPGDSFWGKYHFWAAEVHRYSGLYYLFGSFKADNVRRGTQILVAERPIGPFRPITDRPITPPEWECLDGTLFIDDEGAPWIVFCHEWVQVRDGEICAMRLTPDLKEPAGEPILLFRAGQAPWVREFTQEGGYVTDGPFLYRASNGELLMLWSSFAKDGYCQAVARSSSGKITGPWTIDPEPIYTRDGGHGMLFRTLDGELMLSLHAPNSHGGERPIIMRVEERNGQLRLTAPE